MSVQYDTHEEEEQAVSSSIPSLAQHLETYLEPLLIWLDAYLDKRLVRTLVYAISAILQFRGNGQALQLSELGAYLPCSGKEPAKTKRLQNLLSSKKWGKAILDEFIWRNADEKVREMRAGERILCIWDGSVLEKTDSEKSEGMCSVLSSKAKHLNKYKKGIFNQRGGKPITVFGMEWTGVIILGEKEHPILAKMQWWSRKGDKATAQRNVEGGILLKIYHFWHQWMLHVCDRGYGTGRQLEIFQAFRQSFVIRWKKGNHFFDEQGEEKALSQIVGRTRSKWHKQLWHFQKRCYVKTGILVKRVRHEKYAGDLWVVAVRQKGEPWYLITNVPIETEKEAWEIVFAYRARWKIETCFRYGKSELCLETVNLRDQEKREKMLLLVMVVYMFLLSMMEEAQRKTMRWLLYHYCHRTGKKQNEEEFPIYRLRWAISRYWQKCPPSFSFTILGGTPKVRGAT
jgi:hypothetical protein